jgi:hypothetical protein
LRARIVVPGREAMAHQQRRLLFVLVTTDLSAKSREQIQRDFGQLPIVERYTSAEVEAFFAFRGAKVLGFRRSTLAQALLKELKPFRLPPPAVPQAVAPQPAAGPLAAGAGQPVSAAAAGPVAPPATGPKALPIAEAVTPVLDRPAPGLPARPEDPGWRARRRLQKTARATPRLKTRPPQTP